MITGIDGYQNSKKDTSLLYCSSFKYSDGELGKNTEFMASDMYQNQKQQNSGLARYCSAPSSFYASLLDYSGGGVNEGHCAGCGGLGYMETSKYGLANSDCMKQEIEEITDQSGYSDGSQMIYLSSSPLNPLTNGSFKQMRLQSSMEVNSGLARQNSSPSGLLSNICSDNGYPLLRDMVSSGVCDGKIGDVGPSTSTLSKHLNFNTSCSRIMPPISDICNKSMGLSSPENDSLNMHNFPTDSWESTSFSGRKRARYDEENSFSGLNTWETQNANCGKRPSGLTHRLSLPKISAVEKYLQFQGSVPCKIRAKRGFATHPRSIAERVRRTRISERMRKLQDLFPDMDKQTNTADMLDWTVEFIKDLQNQVQKLSETKVKCTCSIKQGEYSNASA